MPVDSFRNSMRPFESNALSATISVDEDRRYCSRLAGPPSPLRGYGATAFTRLAEP